MTEYYENGAVYKDSSLVLGVPCITTYYFDEDGEQGMVEQEDFEGMPVCSISFHPNGDVSCVTRKLIQEYFPIGRFNQDRYLELIKENQEFYIKNYK